MSKKAMDMDCRTIQVGSDMVIDRESNIYGKSLKVEKSVTASRGTFNGDVTVNGSLTVNAPIPQSVVDNVNTLASTTYTYYSVPDMPLELPLIRLTPVDYADGIGSVDGSLPNPRALSNAMCAQTPEEIIPNPKKCTDMFWLTGQIVDHDLDLTPTGSESMNIPVPSGDPFFDPSSTGTVEIVFNRSKTVAGTGVTTPREHFTEITYELDLSSIYGSCLMRYNWLRQFWKGRLKTGPGSTLPVIQPGDMPALCGNAGPTGQNIYMSGDVRANENTGLLSMHNVWVREHNFWADNIYALNKSFSDEKIYQLARLQCISENQSIIYNEFVPLLLGDNALPPYAGYQSGVSTAVSTEFSTAAYRLGHSLLSEVLLRQNNDGTTTEPYGNLQLLDAFFAPDKYCNYGSIGPLLRGMCRQICQKVDSKIVNAVRNFLFGPPGAGGHDLAALNIQRGRDHGISKYNAARVALGMSAKANFNEITSDAAVASALSAAYGGDISRVDMWVGGLAEDKVSGSQVGELFQHILVDQFTRSRDGDPLFYKNNLPASQIEYIDSIRLRDVLERNTCAANLQEYVMKLD